ncbi:MAG: MBL fold metallo-hydrolase [Microscillaceae bacterium]
MRIEQIYTGCLAQGAYYIESEGEVAIIDPLREVKPYLEEAARQGHRIQYILETHFHADFVSGHVDLAQKTGAKIVYGPGAKTSYEIYEAQDGEELPLGKVRIQVLHTPGHTLESTTFLLKDENGKDHAIFTGDTLFIGDVGRPDLAQKSDLSQEDLAGMLYDSLHQKVMPLADDVIVYPAHGAGSACGKNMSKETFDTLGHQKQTNYALKAKTKEEFIQKVTEGILPPPQYFAKNAMMNKQGYDSIDVVMQRGTTALPVADFEEIANQEMALVLDTRAPQTFAKGFIPNSIFIGLDGSFAPWVGALIPDLKQALLIVADPGREEEVVMRLARVGYDNALGYLKGGFEAWQQAGKEVDTILSISAASLAQKLAAGQVPALLDARKPTEFEAEHAEAALNFPLDFINERMAELDRAEEYHIHCAGGYRSMIMASILKARGFEKVVDIDGGFKAIQETNIPRTAFVCPSTQNLV